MSFSDMEAAFADSPPSSSCASSGSGSRSPSPETVPFEGFEGPEKKLEIEFDVPADDDCGLRVLTQAQWQKVLDAACCTILSCMSNKFCDSYVLSESSLFVYRHKLLLKTCGTTTLLHVIPLMLEHAERLGMNISYCFFSRKALTFPHAQKHPHRCATDETEYLDGFFDGNAYILGPLKGDYWFVYQYDRHPTQPAVQPEVNLEIMMHDLSPKKMAQFFNKPGADAKSVTVDSGIGNLLPGSMIDEFLFDPCGYSMNGLLGEAMWTIHITPEDHCSFVSFETNVQLPKYCDLIQQVFDIFDPGRCTVTLFADQGAVPIPSSDQAFGKTFPNYSLVSRTHHEFDGTYDVTMCNYVRQDFTPKLLSKGSCRGISPTDSTLLNVPNRTHSPNSRDD